MRVAVYARVSTEHEAQINALENQLEWYKIECSRHSDWEIVEVYVDQGITGTQAQKRPEFLRIRHGRTQCIAMYIGAGEDMAIWLHGNSLAIIWTFTRAFLEVNA